MNTRIVGNRNGHCGGRIMDTEQKVRVAFWLLRLLVERVKELDEQNYILLRQLQSNEKGESDVGR